MSVAGPNPYAAFQSLKPATTGVEKPEQQSTADQVAKTAVDFRETLQQAEQTAIDTAVSGADPHAMVEALANAEMVLETAVTIRDKVVEAYQELLRMPV